MFTDLGAVALVIGLMVAAYSALAAPLGRGRSREDLVASAYRGVLVVAGVLTVAVAILIISFLRHDFGVRYVAEYSSRAMPWYYVVSAFYGGQQGSLLYWTWTLSLLAALVLLSNRRQNAALMPYVVAVLMAIATFFLSQLVFSTNPFERMAIAPDDGAGLNPLLRDKAMLIHPPVLLFGYVSLSVPYAFAMAALWTGRLDGQWLRTTRRWALSAWFFLALGNLLGAWWAYHVLGWGGYWGWDPVENSALMPWLISSAYLHSVIIQERWGMLKVWNVVLVILAYTLSLFGTFIARSGIISSVHSFAQSTVGPSFFAFLGIMLTVSLGLLFLRAPLLRGEREYEALVSRESGFLFNNVLLVGITFATFLGVIFPLVTEATSGVKITVGAPYYNQVNGPLFLALLALMGLGPMVPWRRTTSGHLLRHVRPPLLAAGLVTASLAAAGVRPVVVLVAYGICGFVGAALLREFWRGMRARQHALGGAAGPRALASLVRGNRRRYGGYLVHLGVVVLAGGILGSSFFQLERAVILAPGQRATIGAYTLTFRGVTQRQDADKRALVATLVVARDGMPDGIIQPEKDTYTNFEQQPTTGVAIRSRPFEDLYVVVAGTGAGGEVSFNLFVNPMMLWLWAGGAIVLLGGLTAWWPQRRLLGIPSLPPAVRRPQPTEPRPFAVTLDERSTP